nr:hypothetical protein [Elizabethkingia sp. ASV34]
MRSKLLTGTFLGIALFAFQSCRENNMTAEDSVSPQAKASGAVAGSTFLHSVYLLQEIHS